MRVTMVNKYYPPHLGGVEYIMRDLAEGLASREGVEVRAIVANEGRDRVEEVVNGVGVTRLPRLFAYASTPVAPAMRRAIRDEAARRDPPDVLHLHFPYPWGEWSWLRADPGLPAVVTYHSDIVRQKRLLAMYKPLLERFLRRVDLVMTSSPNMIEASEFLRPLADKCRPVPFGLDPARYELSTDEAERAAALRAGHDRPVVLFVGRLIYYKGVDVLVRAMADVDADLVVIGRGPLESSLRQTAVAHRVAERITFLPPLGDHELVEWFHAADVLCLPSVARSEAFGIVQMEAHVCGTPVVSTDLSTGVPFVNKDGVSGLVVPVGDAVALGEALQRLVTDPELRERLGRQARERALAEFTVDRYVDGTLEVYREALASRARGAR